jgi:hypothetical protein
MRRNRIPLCCPHIGQAPRTMMCLKRTGPCLFTRDTMSQRRKKFHIPSKSTNLSAPGQEDLRRMATFTMRLRLMFAVKPRPLASEYMKRSRNGIWSYNGLFNLVDSWTETNGNRRVFKFKLHSIPDETSLPSTERLPIEQRRVIPSLVKLAVWKRDGGACIQCGSKQNLHFDHILPYSKGGTSVTEENIQLLCMKHNIQKGAKLL